MNSSNLKICILGTAYPYKGGIASFNERMAKALQAKGHEVEIITFTLQYPNFLYPGQNQYADHQAPESLKITRKLNAVNPLTWMTTGRLLKSGDYDIIISKFWIPVVGMSLGAAIKRGKRKGQTTAVCVIDNIIPHEKRPGDGFFRNYFISSIDAAVAMSKIVQKDTQRLYPNLPLSYYPHPIYDNYGEAIGRELAIEKLSLNADRQYILFFGFIRKYKGLDLLLQAFNQMKDDYPTWDLIVAGEFYIDKEPIDQYIEENCLDNRVHLFTQFIANDEVKYFFSAADIVAQTYRSATQSGISQMAINFLKPIISTNVGGLPETVREGENGILVSPDTESIADGLAHIINHPESYYSNTAMEELKSLFSWEAFTDAIIELHYQLKAEL